MTGAVLLDRHSGKPIVPPGLRELLIARERGDVAELIERSRLMPTIVAAERTPPLYMDVNNAYSGDELGLPNRDFIGEGVVAATDLAVTAHAAANSIDIAAGSCWVLGDTNPALQPNYRCYNDAVVNLGISPDPTNPRRVLVGAQVTDQGFAGVGRTWQLQALHGTPAGAPVLPATPASFLPLANVLVPAAAASSAAYTITDLRSRARIGGGQALGASAITTSTWAGGPPATPSDTDIWIATAVDSNDVRWMFQYNAGTASAYKWDFIGGADVNLLGSGGSFNGTSTNTSQLTFTATRAGEYNLSGNIYGIVSAAGIGTFEIIYFVNGASVGNFGQAAQSASLGFSIGGTETFVTPAAGQTIGTGYWANQTGSIGTYSCRIVPRRIA